MSLAPFALYAEDFQPDHLRPIVRDLPAWLAQFKARHAEDPPGGVAQAPASLRDG